jgi:hypothetical protein
MPIRSYKPRSKGTGRSFNGSKASDDMKWGSEWKAYRKRFIETNPRCYACGSTATVVDHLRPHKGDEKLFKQLDNHLPLCETCHNRVTGLFDKRFVVGGSLDSKIKWMQLQRLNRGLTFRVKVLPYYGEDR